MYHKWRSYDVWFLRYQARQTECFVILGYFLPFYPAPVTLTIQKIKILEKWINQNHMMYDSWDMDCDRQNFFSFWTTFCPFTPPPINNPKNQNFEKMKKNPRDIIILHKCIINDNHMIHGSWDINCNSPAVWDIIILHKCTKNHDHRLYCSWDMAHDRYNCYFSFWVIFCPFTPLTAGKNKNFRKTKKLPGDIVLHKCTKTHDHMLYCSWYMVHVGCNCFSFGLFFALLPP